MESEHFSFLLHVKPPTQPENIKESIPPVLGAGVILMKLRSSCFVCFIPCSILRPTRYISE